MWNISEKRCDTPYLFRRNREAGGAADRLAWRCALCYRAAEKRKFSLLVITAAALPCCRPRSFASFLSRFRDAFRCKSRSVESQADRGKGSSDTAPCADSSETGARESLSTYDLQSPRALDRGHHAAPPQAWRCQRIHRHRQLSCSSCSCA